MNNIVVFWIQDFTGRFGPPDARCKTFKDLELREALAFAERMRQSGAQHVCISTRSPDNVSKPGVDSIEDGKTPDGEEYTWKKRR